MADGRFQSLAVAVIEGGRSETFSFGTLDGDPKRVPDTHTLYEIGSLTKTFTGLLLAEAVRRGEVGLETPLAEVLKGWSLPAVGARPITFLDLATHTSGLPRLPGNLHLKDPQNPYMDYTDGDLRACLVGAVPERAPGAAFEYSNLGYGLLGKGLALRAGRSYGELVAARIAGPLGLHETFVDLPKGAEGRLAPPHDAAGAKVSPWDMGALAGAGAVHSSLGDLVRYLQAHMAPAGELKAALAEVRHPRRPGPGAGTEVGLAWMIQKAPGGDLIWHNGMTGGYASFAGFTANGRRGVVLLANSAQDLTELGLGILSGKAAPPPRRVVRLEPESLKAYLGRYRLASGVHLDVSLGMEGLEAQVTGQPRLPIYASAQDAFFYKAVEAQITFGRGPKGEIAGLVVHQGGRDMEAPRVGDVPAAPVEISLGADQLKDYEGTYPLAPDFALVFKVEGGQLFAQATGQARLPVFPSARDAFFYKAVDAQLRFRRDMAGRVEGVVLVQNGRELPGTRQ